MVWWLGLVWSFHLRWSQPRYSWREVWQQAHLRRPCAQYCLPCLSNNWYLWGWCSVSLWTPLCCSVATMHLFSQSLSIVLRCAAVLVDVIFGFSNARCIRWPGCALFRLSCRCVIDVMLLHCVSCTRLIQTLIILYNELPSASVRVRQTRAAAAAHPLEFEVSRCRTSLFARCFLPALTPVCNDLPYTVFDTGTLEGLSKGAVNRWWLSWFCFSVFRGAGTCGTAKAIYKQFCFSNLGLCCWF